MSAPGLAAACNGAFFSKGVQNFFLQEKALLRELSWRFRIIVLGEAFLYAAPFLMIEASLLYGTLFATASLVRGISFCVFCFLGLYFCKVAGETFDTWEADLAKLDAAKQRALAEYKRTSLSDIPKNLIKIQTLIFHKVAHLGVEEGKVCTSILKEYVDSEGKRLDFSGMNFSKEELETLFSSEGFSKLEFLDLSETRLQELPDLSNLPSLRYLIFAKNPLRTWPLKNLSTEVQVTLDYESLAKVTPFIESLFPENKIPESVVFTSFFAEEMFSAIEKQDLDSRKESFFESEAFFLHEYTVLILQFPWEKRALFLEKSKKYIESCKQDDPRQMRGTLEVLRSVLQDKSKRDRLFTKDSSKTDIPKEEQTSIKKIIEEGIFAHFQE